MRYPKFKITLAWIPDNIICNKDEEIQTNKHQIELQFKIETIIQKDRIQSMQNANQFVTVQLHSQ